MLVVYKSTKESLDSNMMITSFYRQIDMEFQYYSGSNYYDSLFTNPLYLHGYGIDDSIVLV